MRPATSFLMAATMLLSLAACASRERDADQEDSRRPPVTVPGSVDSYHPEED